MIPETLPEGTTLEQWNNYEMERLNHEARIRNKREFLLRVTTRCHSVGPGVAFAEIMIEIDKESSMDAPNEPGYYRANND